MKWEIRYWTDERGKSPIEQWLDKLTNDQLKAVAKELKLLELCGNDLKLPHSRSLGSGLFELRDQKFGYRVYYCYLKDKIILLLAVGDKKTQARDIQQARDKLTVIKKREANDEN